VTGSEHIADRALFVAALDAEDPERTAANVHCRSCAECALALRDAQRLLVALDTALSLDAPEPAPLARTACAVHAAERAARRHASAKAAVATLLSGVALVLVSRHHAPDPNFFLYAGSLALAALLAALSIHRPWHVLSVLGALALGLSAGGEPAELSIGLGLKCVGFELLAAAAPVLTLLVHTRRHAMALAPIELAALAGAGSVAGLCALLVACPASHALGHVMLFHAGGVVLASCAGLSAHRFSHVAKV